MEIKSDPLVKKKKLSKSFTANLFEDGLDSLDFLNESLINNRGIKVLNKHNTETADENTALLPEEPVKKVKKRHKRKSSVEEKQHAKTFTAKYLQDRIDFLNDSLKNNKDIQLLNKNGHTCKENYDENTVSPKEPATKLKKVKYPLLEDEKPVMEHVEEKQKRHKKKSTFVEHVNESISLQCDTNAKALSNIIIEGKEKKSKRKSAFKEHDLVVQKDTNDEVISENIRHKNELASEECVQSVKNVDALVENLFKEKMKRSKTKSAFTGEDNENIVIQNEEVEQVIKKKKKHKREWSAIVQEEDTSSLVHIDCIQEDPVKKKKRHKREYSAIVQDENTSSLVNIDSIQEDPAKKRKNHKKEFSAIIQEADTSSLALVNMDYIQDNPVKKKKHKREFSSIVQDEDPSYFLNKDSIKDHAKKMKRHKRPSHTLGQVENNCVMNVNFPYERPAKVKKHKYKLYSADKCFFDKEYATLESANQKESKQIDKLTNLDCSDQRNRTQSDAGLQHIFDINTVKKEVEYVDPPVQHNANEEFSDFLKNSQLTNCSTKEENELMHDMLSFEDELLWGGAPVSISPTDLDLNEDPVEFEIPVLHSSEKLYQVHKEERELLKSQGISVKTGKFTKLEDSLLKRNYNEFTKRFHVSDPQILLGIGQTFRNNTVISFLKAKHFYVRLGKDLNDRALFNIYKRARVLFNTFKNETKLDKTDVDRIKIAYSLMGSKWQKIANIIEKSAETTRSAFLWHDKSINRGKWTAEEESQLISAIKTVSGITDLSNTDTDGIISWEKVANLVPTKNYNQCRLYWVENLSCKFKKTRWTRHDYGKLVSILRNECYVDDYDKVNWKEVQKSFGDISWGLLRKKWYHLTKKLRESKKVMTYKQMLDHYCIVYNIKIDGKLEK